MQLTNVVVQADTGRSLDLRVLTYCLMNARYDPKVFSAVVWQHRKTGGNCLLFSNGKINCNGKCLSLQDGRCRLRRYARKLQKMNYPVRLTNVRVVTASAAQQLTDRIEPTRLPKDFSLRTRTVSCRHVPTSRHAFHLSPDRKDDYHGNQAVE